jgi:hypothetical protein
MTDSKLEKILGTSGRDPGCDAGLDVIDQYCEAVLRGEPAAERYSEFVTHLQNCVACREDTEGLLAALRELENDDER